MARVDFWYTQCTHQYIDSVLAVAGYPKSRRKKIFQLVKFEKSNRRSTHTYGAYGLDRVREMSAYNKSPYS